MLASRVLSLAQISRISQKARIVLLACASGAQTFGTADSKGEATCLREISVICVKLKIIRVRKLS